MIISLTNASITNQHKFVDQNRFLLDTEDTKEHFFNPPKMYFYKKIKQINQIKENVFSIYNLGNMWGKWNLLNLLNSLILSP